MNSVNQSVNGLGHKCFSEMFDEYNCVSGRSPSVGAYLRSVGAGQLVVPRSDTTHGEILLSHYAAHSWNQLPMKLRSALISAVFLPSINRFCNTGIKHAH